MANDEFADYPKARISMGSGDLLDAFEVTHKYDGGEELVHTLRKNPAGSSGGKRNSEITFKAAISEDGPERDYYGKLQKRDKVQLRMKIPGKTITQTGRISSIETRGAVDGFIELSVTHIGKCSFS